MYVVNINPDSNEINELYKLLLNCEYIKSLSPYEHEQTLCTTPCYIKLHIFNTYFTKFDFDYMNQVEYFNMLSLYYLNRIEQNTY